MRRQIGQGCFLTPRLASAAALIAVLSAEQDIADALCPQLLAVVRSPPPLLLRPYAPRCM